MTQQIDRYVVFGNPITQSKSPFIHTLFARQTNQPLTYVSACPPKDGFKQAATLFFSEGGKGCNITAPFKEDAYQFADRLTERAQLAGAVNTLKKLDDGEIIGDNTDGEGLVQDLLQYQVPLKGARILLIGAGGAARGVIKPLLDQNPAEIIITNRTHAKAQQLADMFESYGNIKAINIGEVDESFDVIINSSSSGLTGDLPAISPAIFSPYSVVYDMVYGSGKTKFNQWAAEHSVSATYDGLGMLVGQAAESFMLWRGLRPGSRQILRELRKNLEGLQ
ncbi:shikimate dehydrogenase [Vibrio genomosp. F10]|uniref:Shikimate dehydrogenase (NADP(+)) n=2 Tax=Vibrio genomosp. F10 TaxID=723171 RepID=A0A1B9QXL7_9VIBR|nr:shikimate dehydrogenase [Vibrio genomosp. F10]OCH74824.1 shikimate dehydrogenase [Vibrio genomosp. F10]OEE34727.1 shikimate dehydrogenase [Vibrio genomosp. F10 str. ZF-129]OEE93494.1 shikimate dehydrogenase [Vibrio genomosp. F10 str. 9ZC157]OEF03626.1 shikimate dehydrogenase [Vibrio genomosp. F10 str. 9ZD137]OEF07963.1 shikimate dehydrogenase [Vibrio genomosp. F10 str. 9ZB36]